MLVQTLPGPDCTRQGLTLRLGLWLGLELERRSYLCPACHFARGTNLVKLSQYIHTIKFSTIPCAGRWYSCTIFFCTTFRSVSYVRWSTVIFGTDNVSFNFLPTAMPESLHLNEHYFEVYDIIPVARPEEIRLVSLDVARFFSFKTPSFQNIKWRHRAALGVYPMSTTIENSCCTSARRQHSLFPSVEKSRGLFDS